MTEELGVDGSFGNSAAVDGEILLAATGRVVVDNPGQDVFTHTAFTNYQHTQVNGRHLESDVQCVVQCLAVTYDIVTLFDVLKFGCLHL